MTRAAAYVRVSTGRQAREGLSLAEQERKVEAYIAAQDGWEHIETYVEAGVSGRKDDRPQLKRLLAAVAHGEVDVVVIPKLDRFGRSVRQLQENFDKLKDAGVGLVSLKESIDTSTSVGRLLRNVLAALAEFESDVIGERVASVSAARCAEGLAHGRAPFGYRAVKKQGLVVVSAEAAVIQRVFYEYATEGRSQREICRRLNNDGIKSQRGVWTQGSISKVLASPIYVGRVHVNGDQFQGVHEGIIDKDLWAKAESLREAGTRTRRGKTPTANHLLSGGMLRCPRCGATMYAQTRPQRGNGVTWEAYTCSTRALKGIDACSQPPVRRQPIDKAIWSFFVDVALDLEATKAAITEQADAKLAELAVFQQQSVLEAQRTSEALTRIERDYGAGKITPEQWTRLDVKLTEELAAAEAQVMQFAQQRQALVSEVENIDAESAVLDELTALRAQVVGEVRDGSRTGSDALRTTLRRLFTSFELLSPAGFGKKPADGAVPWPHDDLNGIDGYYCILPRIRPGVIEGYDASFPAFRKVALSLRGSDASGLTR